MQSYLLVLKESSQWKYECLLRLSVCFTVLMMVLALCRQPVLILWPAPWLQRGGNKPLSSYLQTVQQSMRNYLGQSMGQPYFFCLPLLYLHFCPLKCTLSLSPILIPPPLFLLCSFSIPPPPPPPPLFSPAFLQHSSLQSTYFKMRQLSGPTAINRKLFHTFSFAEETFLVILQVMSLSFFRASVLCKIVSN